jgi:ABC-type polysaccharide/polyol phosphate export permease
MRGHEMQDGVRQSFWVACVAFGQLVYSLVVRDLRTEHKNAALGILISVAQPLVAGLVFYFFITFMGGGFAKVRGDYMTFVLLGFVIFFMHVRTVNQVANALREDMLNHQRLSPFLLVSVKGISSAYKIVLALIILIAANYLARDVYEMQNLLLFLSAVFWCWIGGVAVGMVFLAANRYLSWGPLLQTAYVRIMFFTSGKFFVANQLPGFMRPFMDWNPLFHLLDQSRSAAFVNYTARTTSMDYAIIVFLVLLVIAMLVENYVRRNYSQSHMPGG